MQFRERKVDTSGCQRVHEICESSEPRSCRQSSHGYLAAETHAEWPAFHGATSMNLSNDLQGEAPGLAREATKLPSAGLVGTKILIVGLFHSGTTIFWRALRRDSRFVCFDEPFSTSLASHFPNNNPKGTFDEYIGHFAGKLDLFWNMYCTLEPPQQLEPALDDRQRNYLSQLLMLAPAVVIDEPRLHFQLQQIKDLYPDIYLIHLHRRASGFVTSHLLPSPLPGISPFQSFRHRVGHIYRRSLFWNRSDVPLGMGLNLAIGSSPHSKFGMLLSRAGYDADRVMSSSAVVKMLAYWHYLYHLVQEKGPRIFGSRFVDVPYEEFARSPHRTMKALYERMSIAPLDGEDYHDVHTPKPSFRDGSLRWSAAARVAGFSEEEIGTLL
jgi:hypothetical protein